MPVLLELTVTDALGVTHLHGKAYLRIYANERTMVGPLGTLYISPTIVALQAAGGVSSNPSHNLVMAGTNFFGGGIWATPADVNLTLVRSSSTAFNTVASSTFLIDANGDLVAAKDAVGGEEHVTMSWTDLAGTTMSGAITLQLATTWVPTNIVFESLFPGSTPTSMVNTHTNTLYMFPDHSGNYSWPVSEFWSYTGLPGLSITWSAQGISSRSMSSTFQLVAPPTGANPMTAVFVATLPVANQYVVTLGYPGGSSYTVDYYEGTAPININNNSGVYGLTNNLRCLLTDWNTSSHDSVYAGNDSSQSGEVLLSAFAPVGGETNTWIYDPNGVLHIPADVLQTGTTFTIVVVNASVGETSSGYPSATPTSDANVGFYDHTGAFIGHTITVTHSSGNWVYNSGAGLLSNIAAIGFAPFGGSQPTFLSPTTKQYLLRVFTDATVNSVLLPVLSIDPRTVSTTPELFASNTMTGYNTAASGVFGYELQLVLPASVIATEALSSSMTSSESSNSIYSVFQRFTGHTSSELGEPSEAFQCPDSVCFVLNPTPFLTSLSGYIAYSLETSWDGGSTWYILAHNLNGNALGDSFAGTGIRGVLAGPWPERYVTLAADGSIPPWGVGSQVLMYRLGLQTSYGLHTLHRPFEYTHTLSVSSWRYSAPASNPADYTDVNTQFLDFHVPNNVQRFETTRYGLGDLSADVIPYNAHQISATSLLSSGTHVNLYVFR